MTAFTDAVRVAHSALEGQAKMVKPEYHLPFIIVKKHDVRGHFERYAVYHEYSPAKPKTEAMMPWSEPLGEKVARVTLDGKVEAL